MIVPILLLTCLGVAVMYTSSTTLAIQQSLFVLFGILIYFLLRNFDYRVIKDFIKPLYFLTFIFLIVVFILGIETRGSVRWIPLGPFNLQPSEFAKISLILVLADFWSRHLPSWKNILLSFLWLFFPTIFIFRQPDLGTTLTLVFIWLVVLLASNVSLVKMLGLFITGGIIAPLGWFVLHDYQKQRIFSFFSPYSDPLGIGYNVIQSTIAIGSGQILGRGLGGGTQSRLQFLPEFRTDFVFAFIAEELGFLGSIIVLLLYSLIFYFCFKSLLLAKDRFGELIIIGVIAMVFFQMFVNIGMNIGVLPITGITLPLLSYGGSSVLTTLIGLGLVASVGKYGKGKQEIASFHF